MSRLQNRALSTANEIMNVFKKGDLASITKARKVAEDVFGEGWEAKGADIYNEGAENSNVWGIGKSLMLFIPIAVNLCYRTVSVSKKSIVHALNMYAIVAISILLGYGHTALLNKKLRVRGLLKWISWIDTLSIGSRAAPPSNTSGSKR